MMQQENIVAREAKTILMLLRGLKKGGNKVDIFGTTIMHFIINVYVV
ncbi:MAG TPA: hypothetical protein PLB20_08370 [Clostridia bacterium]|jgi:hypothetical protein|nr:hypothetical protein [Clostridia bacterium]